MAHKYLARDDAPFGSETWQTLDQGMVDIVKSQLVGRRLLDIEGPYGLGLKSIPLRDTEDDSGVLRSEMLPLLFIRRSFQLGVRDLASHEREGLPLDLGPLQVAAQECAQLEDNLVLQGAPGIPGLLTHPDAASTSLSSWEEQGAAVEDIIRSVTSLDEAGFHGPYVMALAPARYNRLFRLYERGNMTELDHIQKIIENGVFKAPTLENGGVIMASGRQFASIVLGQDLSLGFIGPAGDGDMVEFSLSESLTIRIRQPKSICALEG